MQSEDAGGQLAVDSWLLSCDTQDEVMAGRGQREGGKGAVGNWMVASGGHGQVRQIQLWIQLWMHFWIQLWIQLWIQSWLHSWIQNT